MFEQPLHSLFLAQITSRLRQLQLPSRLLDLVLAPRCMACDAYLEATDRPHDTCPRCRGTVFSIRSPRCPRCALPRDPVAGRHVAGADDLCRDCATTQRHFTRVEACWEYDGAVADALRRAKYGHDLASLRGVARQAAPWWARRVEGGVAGDDVAWRWTSVPPHPVDLRRRGFDAPSLLARWLGPQLNWERPLLRRQPRLARAGLDRLARARHARKAFGVREGAEVSGRWVIFDDVLTTGATLSAVARALRRAGADEVVGVVLARTPRPSGQGPCSR